MLVLLVIFHAGLPLTQQGLDADIPARVQRDGQMDVPVGQIVAELGADRRLRINREEMTLADAGVERIGIVTEAMRAGR